MYQLSNSLDEDNDDDYAGDYDDIVIHRGYDSPKLATVDNGDEELLLDYITTRLRLARALAMAKYEEVWE